MSDFNPSKDDYIYHYKDYIQHIQLLMEAMACVQKQLMDRMLTHDRSKIEEPELDAYAEIVPGFKNFTFGTEEHTAHADRLGPAWEHHTQHNMHHPEFWDQFLEWKTISEHEGDYEISNYGDVRSIKRVVKRDGKQGNLLRQGQILKANVTPRGYLRIQLRKDGVPKNYLLHRIVANAFLPNPDNFEQINHKDGNKKNNKVSNLEWITPSENLQHAYDNGLRTSSAKYIIHCPELDLTTIGISKMKEKLFEIGYEKARDSGIYKAMMNESPHLGLRFYGTLLSEYSRSPLNDMTLIDLIEMICDWYAASMRSGSFDVRKSLAYLKTEHGMDDQLERILLNTGDWISHKCHSLGPTQTNEMTL